MRILCGILVLAAVLGADTVVLKGGKKVHGAIVSETESEIAINIYNSTVHGVVFGTERFPADRVKKVVRTFPLPHHEFQRRIEQCESAEACLELAAWAEEQKLKEERLVALELALRLDPENEQARKGLGSKAPKGDRPAQTELAKRVVAGDAEALAEVRKDPHFPWSERYLQRARRSAKQAIGLQEDRPIALRADKLEQGARYTLLVPPKYDPLKPTPLVVGLHGGGAGGADGKLVVGNGNEAMNFYRGECERRGWLCACPSALRAGWRDRLNSELIDAMLEEILALYNVDVTRIYLVGHSMGGGGTWSQGSRLPETWAAVAPAASFGVQGIDKFAKTRTGMYVYHSDNDPRCSVDGVRPQMKNLPGSDADFVYTELPGRGHDFPMEVVRDIFEFFSMRRLATRRGRYRPAVRPESSFEAKVSRDEKKYLPDLDDEEGNGDEKLSALLKDLKTGGGVAEQVVPQLAAHPDEKTSSRVAKLLLRPNAGSDVRLYAARILGLRKATDEVDALGRALLIEDDSAALLAMLDALGEIDEASAGDALLRFLKKRHDYFEKRKSGSVLDHSDWATILPPMARACTLVGSFRPDKGAAAIVDTVLEGILLSDVKVRFDRENQDPRPVARALAEAACGALAALGDAAAVPALERMRSAAGPATGAAVDEVHRIVGDMHDWPRDPKIAGAVQEALSRLKG